MAGTPFMAQSQQCLPQLSLKLYIPWATILIFISKKYARGMWLNYLETGTLNFYNLSGFFSNCQ
jgi:hypothetical protein